MAEVIYLSQAHTIEALPGVYTVPPDGEAARMRRELQELVDIDAMRKQMTPDAIATVAAMTALLRGGDIDGAVSLLGQRASRLELEGDEIGASATRTWELVIKANPTGAIEFGDLLMSSDPSYADLA